MVLQVGEARDPSRDPAVVKKMAVLLMQGAVMLQETCPLDGLPLFRLRSGEIVCPVHGRVMIVSSEREARDVEVEEVLYEVMYRAALRLREEAEKGEPGRLREWVQVILGIEEILDMRRRRMREVDDKEKQEGQG